jgi:hypothetical protein
MTLAHVNEVIQEVMALASVELRRYRVETSTELDFNLPSVMADFVQLQQVLLNLVMNAIESIKAVTIDPEYCRSNPYCAISMDAPPFWLRYVIQGWGSAQREPLEFLRHSTRRNRKAWEWVCGSAVRLLKRMAAS